MQISRDNREALLSIEMQIYVYLLTEDYNPKKKVRE